MTRGAAGDGFQPPVAAWWPEVSKRCAWLSLREALAIRDKAQPDGWTTFDTKSRSARGTEPGPRVTLYWWRCDDTHCLTGTCGRTTSTTCAAARSPVTRGGRRALLSAGPGRPDMAATPGLRAAG